MQLFTVITPVATDTLGVFKQYFAIYDLDKQVNERNSNHNQLYISPMYDTYAECRNAAAESRRKLRNDLA